MKGGEGASYWFLCNVSSVQTQLCYDVDYWVVVKYELCKGAYIWDSLQYNEIV